jgi:thiamine-monophosphate kinase
MSGNDALVRDIGEFDLIARLAGVLPPAVKGSPDVGLGIGDDAAIWTPAAGRDLVVTTDALVENVHFRLDWTDWQSLGHKMLAVNVSDIAAMGARPRLATIVLGLTGNERVSDLESLYAGAGSLAESHGIIFAGGDIVRSPHGLTMSVTLLGDVPRGQAMTRMGARPGDLVVVSGTLGASAAGMALLERGGQVGTTAPLLIAAHLRPNPRVALGLLLRERGVTAAMDLSDGLLGDLPKILAASNVSARMEMESVPVLPAVRALFPEEVDRFALQGGEDYELVLTIPESRYDALREAAQAVGASLTAIGHIVEASGRPSLFLQRDGNAVDGPSGAFDHFA